MDFDSWSVQKSIQNKKFLRKLEINIKMSKKHAHQKDEYEL